MAFKRLRNSLVVALLVGLLAPRAGASSILELIGADPSLAPQAPQPTIFFSADVSRMDGVALDPAGKELRIELWAYDPVTNAMVPAYDGMVPAAYLEHRGGKSQWVLTAEGKEATGIDHLQVRQESETTVSIHFRDQGALLPDLDYTTTCFTAWVGPDNGEACFTMEARGRWWRPRE